MRSNAHLTVLTRHACGDGARVATDVLNIIISAAIDNAVWATLMIQLKRY